MRNGYLLTPLHRANGFGVSLPFLTQQAAWLYQRQLSQVRAQLRKVNKPSSTSVSPTPGSVSGSAIASGQPMRRGGSGGMNYISMQFHRPLRLSQAPVYRRPCLKGQKSALYLAVNQTRRHRYHQEVSLRKNSLRMAADDAFRPSNVPHSINKYCNSDTTRRSSYLSSFSR